MANQASLPAGIVDTGSAHDDPRQPEPGIALCLSGGGYRAMVFHLGALWRLNELGYLARLSRISSVSGGSITAGFLGEVVGARRRQRHLIRLRPRGSAPIRAGPHHRRPGRHLGGIFLPARLRTAWRGVRQASVRWQDAAGSTDQPRFVINATSVSRERSSASRAYVADYRVGTIRTKGRAGRGRRRLVRLPSRPLALPRGAIRSRGRRQRRESEDLHREPFLSLAVLTDGGVYDNLGLETAWKRYRTLLVSNGGGKMQPEEDPHEDWARHAIRINDIIDNEVRSLRARQVIDAFRTGSRQGAYWGIRTGIDDYDLADAMPCPEPKTLALANVATRLAKMEAVLQERLINWGYAVCDAAMRKHVVPGAPAPRGSLSGERHRIAFGGTQEGVTTCRRSPGTSRAASRGWSWPPPTPRRPRSSTAPSSAGRSWTARPDRTWCTRASSSAGRTWGLPIPNRRSSAITVSAQLDVHVTVERADGTAAKARELGGTLMMDPFDVMEHGRMAVIQDPTGAVLSIWEPRKHIGVQLRDEPNTLCWNELYTRDTSRASTFCTGLFGWRAKRTRAATPSGTWVTGRSEG
jgi:NTE family protein